MRKRTRPSRINGLRIGLLIGVIILFCVLAAAAGVNGQDSVPVDAGSVDLRLLGLKDNWLVFLLQSQDSSGQLLTYLKDTSSPEEAMAEAEGVAPGLAYFIDGDYLRVAERVEESGEVEGEVYVNIYTNAYFIDAALEQNYEETRIFVYDPEDGDKLFFAGPDAMYIRSKDGSLRVCYNFSKPEKNPVLSDVTFISSAPGGWVYAYSGSTLTRLDGSGNAVGYEGAPCPEQMVGENAYIDTDGRLVRIMDGTCVNVELPIEGLNKDACFATEEYVIAADGSGTLYKFDWDDLTHCTTAEVDGEILGIAGEYALTANDGKICLSQLVFQEKEEPTPTPVPTPTPTPEPTLEPTPTQEPTSEPSESPAPSQSPTPGATEEPSDPEPSDTSTPSPTPAPGNNDEVGEIIDRIQFKELNVDGRKYISTCAGARVSEIRKIYEPQALKFSNKDGGNVYESILKTGMRIKVPTADGTTEDEIVVVVLGDCDGNGRVTEDDVIFASLYLLNAQYTESEEQFLSMDTTGDGKFSIWDLPPIARETKRNWR